MEQQKKRRCEEDAYHARQEYFRSGGSDFSPSPAPKSETHFSPALSLTYPMHLRPLGREVNV